MDTGMLTVAMEGKCSMGQLFLSDLKGADTVFSVENRNAAYAADRRKVVKNKKGEALSSSWHDEARGNGDSSGPKSANGFFSYHTDQRKVRSGGRRPPARSKSMDNSSSLPWGGVQRDDNEDQSNGSDGSDDSSFTNDLNKYSKKAQAETNYMPRRGGRRSKSLDFTDTDITVPKSDNVSTNKVSQEASTNRKVPGRSESAELGSQRAPTNTSNKSLPRTLTRGSSVKELAKKFSTNPGVASNHSSNGKKGQQLDNKSTCSNKTDSTSSGSMSSSSSSSTTTTGDSPTTGKRTKARQWVSRSFS